MGRPVASSCIRPPHEVHSRVEVATRLPCKSLSCETLFRPTKCPSLRLEMRKRPRPVPRGRWDLARLGAEFTRSDGKTNHISCAERCDPSPYGHCMCSILTIVRHAVNVYACTYDRDSTFPGSSTRTYQWSRDRSQRRRPTTVGIAQAKEDERK